MSALSYRLANDFRRRGIGSDCPWGFRGARSRLIPRAFVRPPPFPLAEWAVDRKILPLARWQLLLRFRAGRKYNDAYLRTLRLRWRFVVCSPEEKLPRAQRLRSWYLRPYSDAFASCWFWRVNFYGRTSVSARPKKKTCGTEARGARFCQFVGARPYTLVVLRPTRGRAKK